MPPRSGPTREKTVPGSLVAFRTWHRFPVFPGAHIRQTRRPQAPRRRGRGRPCGNYLASDDDEDAAGRVFDEGLGKRAAPPARRLAVEVLVADDDQVGADLLRMARDLVHRVADEDLPAHRVARLRESV